MMINLTVCQSFIRVRPGTPLQSGPAGCKQYWVTNHKQVLKHGNVIGNVMESKIDKSGQEQELKGENVEGCRPAKLQLWTGCPLVLAKSAEQRVSCLATSQHYIVIILSPCHTSPHQPGLALPRAKHCNLDGQGGGWGE